MSPLTTISTRHADLPDKEYTRLVRLLQKRQSENAKSSGLQLAGGIALGCIAGSLGGPIVGIIAGGAIVAIPILKALDDGAIDQEIEETGVLAPYLSGKEFERYTSIVGSDRVIEEISIAREEMSDRVSKDAQRLFEQHQYRQSVSDGVQASVQQLSSAAVSSVLPIGQPEPQSSRLEIDVAAFMVKQLRPTLISAKQRSGKGVLIAQFLRLAQAQGIRVWVVQPKAVAAELGYWQTADRFLGCYLSTMGNSTEFTEEFMALVRDYRQQATEQNPIILIVDECVLIESELPSWYKADFVSFVKSEISSGETTGRFLYLISQSPQVGDLKISGGNRSNFNLLTLQTPDSSEHWASIKASYKGVFPDIPTGIFSYSRSPKRAVAITNGVANPSWCTVPKYPVYDYNPTTASADIQRAIERGRVHGMGGNAEASLWKVITAAPDPQIVEVAAQQVSEANQAYQSLIDRVEIELSSRSGQVKLTDITTDNERRRWRDQLLTDLQAKGYSLDERSVNGSAIKSVVIDLGGENQ